MLAEFWSDLRYRLRATFRRAAIERELADEVASRIQKHEEMIKSVSEEKARRILATAIHRYAAEHTADTTVSTSRAVNIATRCTFAIASAFE